MEAEEPRRAALLVTAHPDDECMFFTPLILGLQAQGLAVCLLCLSTGVRAWVACCLVGSDPAVTRRGLRSHTKPTPVLHSGLPAGNAEGLGAVRARELRQACAVLGVRRAAGQAVGRGAASPPTSHAGLGTPPRPGAALAFTLSSSRPPPAAADSRGAAAGG